MRYSIYYKKEPTFRPDPDLTIGNLLQTHVYVTAVHDGKSKDWSVIDETNYTYKAIVHTMEEVFTFMQAERWSPHGEMRPLIESLGLKHTSMSVGDVIANENGEFYEVDSVGFRRMKV